MQITINQQSVDCEASDSLQTILARYCDARGIQLNDLAVARDDTLIPRSTWSDYRPQDGHTFTVFSAVAGG